MNRKQFAVMVVLVVGSGLAGGALTNMLVAARPVMAGEMDLGAQKKQLPPDLTRPRKFIRTEGVELTDRKGTVRARFGLAPDGAPALVFYDAQRGVSLTIGLNSSGNPDVSLQGKLGARVALNVSSDGNPVMVLKDKKGRTRSILGLMADGSPGLVLSDKSGKMRVIIRLGPDGSPVVALQDEKEKARAILGSISPEFTESPLPKRPISSLVLFDQNEKVIWKTP